MEASGGHGVAGMLSAAKEALTKSERTYVR
jgi:hypothetical protein